MPVRVETDIRANPQLAPLVDEAERILVSVLYSHVDEVTADWSLSRDARGQPVIELKLSDYAGSVSRRFTAEELAKTERLEFQLAALRRDLMQIRGDKQLQRFKELLAEFKEE